jgi:hypothetical protein
MGGSATSRLEVGDGPDGRAPPASDRSQKKKEGRGARPAEGRKWASVGHCARGKEGRRPGSFPGLKEKERGRGWADLRRKERGEGVKFFFSFFILFSNSFLKLSKFNQTENHAFKS